MARMRLGGALPVLLSLALCAGCAAPRAWGDGVSLQTNLLGGYALVEHATLDGYPVAGLEVVTRDPEGGWGYELGGSYGSEEPDDAGEEAEITELYLGLRRWWVEEGRALRPYVGFGGSWVQVEDGEVPPDFDPDEASLGAYVRGGALWRVGSFSIDPGTEFFVGLDGRGLIGDDLNSGQLALVLGFGR
jgi:hypothetical protein